MNLAPRATHPTEVERKHDFTSKLRQPSLMPSVQRYVDWQKSVRQAVLAGEKTSPMPEIWGPISINLDLTTACNYRCDHCIDWDMLNSKVRYDYEKLLKSLENLIARGLCSVILIGGGEPTLHPKFRETVRFLKERGVQIAVVSNGSRNDLIHDIAGEFGEKDWVRLSLDSASDSLFERMHKPRKGATLSGICSWVPRIRDKNPKLPIGFSFIIVWKGAERTGTVDVIPNIEEIVGAAKLARDHCFSYIAYKPFLTRHPNGAEVMEAGEIENFNQTVTRIRSAVAEAKTYETKEFRVIESTNLRVLMDGSWKNFTHQPKVCHMQAFRQVLSPLGLFNCPAHRGVEKARIAGADSYNDEKVVEETVASTSAILSRFDASKECQKITCLYNPVNWWLERAINGELDPGEAGPLSEIGDYYL